MHVVTKLPPDRDVAFKYSGDVEDPTKLLFNSYSVPFDTTHVANNMFSARTTAWKLGLQYSHANYFLLSRNLQFS